MWIINGLFILQVEILRIIWAIRPYVLMCEGDDPLKDPWKENGNVKAKRRRFSFQDFSLDMTVFENMGQWYCVWAGKS